MADPPSCDSRISLDALPDIVLEKILGYLEYKDIVRCGLTCHRISCIAGEDSIWKKMCLRHWLETQLPKEMKWKQFFCSRYRQFGRYIKVYPDIRRAWNKIEAFTKENVPHLYNDLLEGVSEARLDMLERQHKVKYPDDMRCSYMIHNGQGSGDSMYPGLLGSLAVYHQFTNETMCPVTVTYEYLDNPEEFCDLHMLSYCYRTKVGAVLALSENGGHVPGQVFYGVPDVQVLHSGEGIFIVDKFIIADSYGGWLTAYADKLHQNMYPVVQNFIYRFFHEPTCVSTSHHITVSVATAFLPKLSSVHPPYFVHGYRITMKMAEDAPESASCQLTARHWVISEDEAEDAVVDGPGVVGEFPVMTPGREFSWVSTTSFNTTHGYMHGYFTMRNLNSGQHVQVQCPVFHMKCFPYQKWEERREIVLQRKKQQRELGLPPTPDVLELEMDERSNHFGFTADESHELLSYGLKPWDEDAYDFLDQLNRARADDDDDDGDDDDDDDDVEDYQFGFPADQAHELLSYGIKPWEEGAQDFLDQLQAAREEYDHQDDDPASQPENAHSSPGNNQADGSKGGD